MKRSKSLRAKKSLRQLTEEKNRARLAAGEPLSGLSRSTPLNPRAKKPKRSRREVDPDFHIGICGEHGGNPRSIEIAHRIGLTYVSCSPYRIPIARLSAAQAALKEKA